MITQQTIQERSYLIWEREGRPFGRHAEHWAQAEAELIAERSDMPKSARAPRAIAPALASVSLAKKKRSKAAARLAMN